MVKAFADGFGGHVAGWFFEGDEDTDGGVFAVGGVAEVADVAGFDVATLDLDDDALCLAGIVVDEDHCAKNKRASVARPTEFVEMANYETDSSYSCLFQSVPQLNLKC